MLQRNQSRPTAGTMERQTLTIDHGQDTTPESRCQGHILGLIPHGPANAITARQLTRLTGLGGRDIRRRIAAARAAGTVILSDKTGGYFLPSDNGQRGRDEVAAWLARITAKGVSTIQAGASARLFLRNVLPGQQRIGGGDDGKA